jgi:DNA-binding CsgD family transcriptional regulator
MIAHPFLEEGAVAEKAHRKGTLRIANAAIALLIVDDDCRVTEANLAASRILGLGRNQVVGRPLGELLMPAAAERLDGVWRAFHETGGHAGPFELEGPGAAGPVDISVTARVVPGRHLVLLSPSQARSVTPPPNGSAPKRWPTARERQILTMLAGGDTDVVIAERLELSPATVQTHVRNAKAKLGARTRAQAVAMALRGGLIPTS